MDDTMKATVETLVGKVEAKTKELAELKRTINFLVREAGGEPMYADESNDSGSGAGGTMIHPDRFYGKSPITAAREYLESRRRAVRVEEVLAALEAGGFDFEAQGWRKQDRLRSLAISLSKNTAVFHKLPNGTYGLVKFYPDLQEKKRRAVAEVSEEIEKQIEAQREDEANTA